MLSYRTMCFSLAMRVAPEVRKIVPYLFNYSPDMCLCFSRWKQQEMETDRVLLPRFAPVRRFAPVGCRLYCRRCEQGAVLRMQQAFSCRVSRMLRAQQSFRTQWCWMNEQVPHKCPVWLCIFQMSNLLMTCSVLIKTGLFKHGIISFDCYWCIENHEHGASGQPANLKAAQESCPQHYCDGFPKIGTDTLLPNSTYMINEPSSKVCPFLL